MSALRRAVEVAVAVAVLLAAWAALAWVLRSPALPGPLSAIADLVRGLSGDLLGHLAISAGRVLAALTIALGLAVPAGLAMGRHRRADALLAPLVFLTYPVPKIALLPVFLVLLGIGNASKIALIMLVISFQILVTTRDAARALPAAPLTSVRSLGASRWQEYRHVVIPACAPAVFTSVRLSAGHAIAVLFLSETIAGTDGLGYAVIDAWSRVQYSEMFAGVLTMALLGIALYEIVDVSESRVCRWQRSTREPERASRAS